MKIILVKNRFVFGLLDTIQALEIGAVETLILWENLDIMRTTSLDKISGNVKVKFQREKLCEQYFDLDNTMSLVEWLSNNYKKFGCALEFITNKSQEGSQFVKGFGGIGGILRYQINMNNSSFIENEVIKEKDCDWDTDFDFI